ncbi:MAG: CPBP family intramembrane metalloprotease [Planctomycetales bacterium]|nr:CPBP family intramembrane metalloprotease [Planctomycetales bacterium]
MLLVRLELIGCRMKAVLSLLMSVVTFAILATSLMAWVHAFKRLMAGQPIIEDERTGVVPWNWFMLLVVALTFLVVIGGCQLVTMLLLGLDPGEFDPKSATPFQHFAVIMAFSTGMLISTAIGYGLVWSMTRCPFASLGLSLSKIRVDARIALVAFAMLIVPTLLCQLALVQMLPASPEHPFVKIVKDSQNGILLWCIAFAAIVAAPMSEEFLFRVMLQGWLERILVPPSFAATIPTGDVADIQALKTSESSATLNGVSAEPLPPPDQGNPFLSPHDSAMPHASLESAITNMSTGQRQYRGVVNWLPILISSTLFAMAHLGQGPPPIPLFILAVGLGYLYRQTRRIWPSLIVHALVNSLAVAQLVLMSAGVLES